MENDEVSTRPSIGFPLGLALLVMLLFCMSAFFSCCLHWDKLRSLFLSSNVLHSDVETDIPHSPRKPLPPHKMLKKTDQAQSLTVLMPGDQIPKFIAMACPCRPPLPEKVTIIEVQKPPTF